MSRKTLPLFALAFAMMASVANAQPILTFSAGATIPTGDYGKYAKTGWLGNAGVLIPLSNPALLVGGNVLYGGNSHSDFAGDKTSLLGALGTVAYRFGDKTKPGLFLMGNVGMLRHKYTSGYTPGLYGEGPGGSYDASSTGVAFGGGAGFSIPMSRINLHASAGFLTASIDGESTSFLPIQAGVSIPLGQRK